MGGPFCNKIYNIACDGAGCHGRKVEVACITGLRQADFKIRPSPDG